MDLYVNDVHTVNEPYDLMSLNSKRYKYLQHIFVSKTH
jgi:hypothetical protein